MNNNTLIRFCFNKYNFYYLPLEKIKIYEEQGVKKGDKTNAKLLINHI